jgi:hypothetical protein
MFVVYSNFSGPRDGRKRKIAELWEFCADYNDMQGLDRC